jgi:hypothetical protein
MILLDQVQIEEVVQGKSKLKIYDVAAGSVYSFFVFSYISSST